MPLIFYLQPLSLLQGFDYIPLDVELYIRQNAQKIKHETLMFRTGFVKTCC